MRDITTVTDLARHARQKELREEVISALKFKIKSLELSLITMSNADSAIEGIKSDISKTRRVLEAFEVGRYV